MAQLFKLPTPQAAAAAAADRITKIISTINRKTNKVSIAVSGGSTPKLLFQELVKLQIDWATVHLFWVDERGVPPTDAQSNYRMTKEFLLDSLKYPRPTIHRIPSELSAVDAAKRYTEDIVSYFNLQPGDFPIFDIVQLGMGDDAHTASLFPGEPSIGNHSEIVAALYVEGKKQWRITLLPGPIQRASNRICLITGTDKSHALKAVLEFPTDPMEFPMQLAITTRGPTEWYVDEAAAALLE